MLRPPERKCGASRLRKPFRSCDHDFCYCICATLANDTTGKLTACTVEHEKKILKKENPLKRKCVHFKSHIIGCGDLANAMKIRQSQSSLILTNSCRILHSWIIWKTKLFWKWLRSDSDCCFLVEFPNLPTGFGDTPWPSPSWKTNLFFNLHFSPLSVALASDVQT